VAEPAQNCRSCRIPLSGIRAIPPRVLRGVRRHKKNPNYCNICSEKAYSGYLDEITVLFADIRGFTELTTAYGPLRTRAMLDEYFRRASEIFFDRDGLVDHFIGDAIMVFFNAVKERPDHVATAVEGAFELLRLVQQLNDTWTLSQPVGIGIAINTGEAALGVLGSTNPDDFTAIGETVNIAARLQTQAAAGEIVVGEAAYRQIASAYPDAQQRVLDLKGVTRPVTAYVIN
jgi:adenylate cyclase